MALGMPLEREHTPDREPGCLCNLGDGFGGLLIGGYARCPIHSPSAFQFFDKKAGGPIPDEVLYEELRKANNKPAVDSTAQSIIAVDSIVQSIIKKFETRAIKGKLKYGTDLDRKDLGTVDWIEHAQDELMDAILYLEKLKHEFNGNSKA